MDEQEQPINVLEELERDLQSLMTRWLSHEFPYYVPLLQEGERLKIIVRRLLVQKSPFYIMLSYPSLKAIHRSTLWRLPDIGEDNIVFMKINNVVEAHTLWYNSLKKFFQTLPGLTKEDAHNLLVVFDHRDDRNFLSSLCVFCYVLDLQKLCLGKGTISQETKSQPKIEQSLAEGGVAPNISDALDFDFGTE